MPKRQSRLLCSAALAAALAMRHVKVVGWDADRPTPRELKADPGIMGDLEAVRKAEDPDVLCVQGTGHSGAWLEDWAAALPGYDAYWAVGKPGGGKRKQRPPSSAELEDEDDDSGGDDAPPMAVTRPRRGMVQRGGGASSLRTSPLPAV